MWRHHHGEGEMRHDASTGFPLGDENLGDQTEVMAAQHYEGAKWPWVILCHLKPTAVRRKEMNYHARKKSEEIESLPSQVDRESRGPQGERGLEFSRRKKGRTFFLFPHSLGLYNNNVSCLRTGFGFNLLLS